MARELVESELFGHEKGAFTGAVSAREGKFSAADQGSIFLDEIGDMSLETQAKVLRVLQEREFERVGGNRLIRVDVRIIAATNRDIRKMVQDGTFREDLFYRLNVVSIPMPSLRQRPEDIPLLAKHFLEQAAAEYQRTPKPLSPEAYQLLLQHPWPGNVRELKNAIESALIFIAWRRHSGNRSAAKSGAGSSSAADRPGDSICRQCRWLRQPNPLQRSQATHGRDL